MMRYGVTVRIPRGIGLTRAAVRRFVGAFLAFEERFALRAKLLPARERGCVVLRLMGLRTPALNRRARAPSRFRRRTHLGCARGDARRLLLETRGIRRDAAPEDLSRKR